MANNVNNTDNINQMLFSNTILNENYDKFRELIKNKKFIAIDGIIGAGKTTLIKLISNYYKSKGLKVHPIYEPADFWQDIGALDLFYSDIPAKCYEFQTFVYITRIMRVMKEVLAEPDAEIYLLERTVFTDRYIFVEMLSDLLGETRMKMYKTWWDMWNCIIPIKINKWVLLDVGLEESMRRIKIRSRSEEKEITEEYQSSLLQQHHIFYNNLKLELMASGESESVNIVPTELMDKNYITDINVLTQIADIIIDKLY